MPRPTTPRSEPASIWFITPAWQRLALSEVCFDQWTHVRSTLAAHGVELRVVVVADDENLELARAAGFETIEQNNDWLGRRFNDGIEYAARHGADWIAPIGSDTWISPDYLYPLPSVRRSRGSTDCVIVTKDRLAELHVDSKSGVGPFMYHRSLLRGSRFRPCEDQISRRIDSSTMRGIGRPINWQRRDLTPYQHIGFRGQPLLTSYARLWGSWGVRELRDPWSVLAEHYPAALVERARRALVGTVKMAAVPPMVAATL